MSYIEMGLMWEGCLVVKGKKENQVKKGLMTRSYINYYQQYYQQNVFVCQSIGNPVGISDTSLYDFLCSNPTVIQSVKTSIKNYMSSYFLVFKIPFILTRIPSVFTNRNIISVNINGVSDGINSVGKYYPKIPIKVFRR